jgi:pyrimidine operon attenuation protein/uracil phosphoribosyltransferase
MRVLADQKQFAELTSRLAAMISAEIARTTDGAPWALVGIRSRGDVLAARLAEKLGDSIGDRVGSLDITLYRDDLSEVGSHAIVQTTEVPFSIDGMHVVLVDDVLMTGRSIRAALQSLMDLGRPRRVWLSVLVDRGGRELPIAPDHVALNLAMDPKSHQIAPGDVVAVQIKPTDPRDEIVILPGKKGTS